MTLLDLTKMKRLPDEVRLVRAVLEKHDRAKILEIYFARLDGREPEKVPEEFRELYELELDQIKAFLLGQHPPDPLLQKIFRIMQ